MALALPGRRPLRRPRLFRDRYQPLDMYDDDDFIQRYRFDRQSSMALIDLLEGDLSPETARNYAVPASLQVFVALRFFACGSIYSVVADAHGLSRSTVCRIVHRVARAMCLRLQNIQFPTSADSRRAVKLGFYQMAGFPNVLGAIDGCHVMIKKPSGGDQRRTYAYRCRKDFFSVNVLGICDSNLWYVCSDLQNRYVCEITIIMILSPLFCNL